MLPKHNQSNASYRAAFQVTSHAGHLGTESLKEIGSACHSCSYRHYGLAIVAVLRANQISHNNSPRTQKQINPGSGAWFHKLAKHRVTMSPTLSSSRLYFTPESALSQTRGSSIDARSYSTLPCRKFSRTHLTTNIVSWGSRTCKVPSWAYRLWDDSIDSRSEYWPEHQQIMPEDYLVLLRDRVDPRDIQHSCGILNLVVKSPIEFTLGSGIWLLWQAINHNGAQSIKKD